MPRDWEKELKMFENFLENIDVEKYSHLREIKTVEQDLPNELLPLEIYYRHYWDTSDFKDYIEVFKIYWYEKLNPYIYDFIKKYFYGCSLQFVEEGLKARLYRIWMSILTQFHFQYLWNALFYEKLESNPKLDQLGIDAKVVINQKIIGIQIEKVSFRREVSQRKFTKRQKGHVDLIIEVPYIVIDLDELKEKIKNPRTKETTKKYCHSLLNLFSENFIKLSNGFVIFKKNYLKYIYDKINQRDLLIFKDDKITYDKILPL